jgi:hypothetical protein
MRFRSSETLKQFLEDQAGRENEFAALERPVQRDYMGLIGRCIPSQSQRPDTGVDKETHSRERSDL